MLTQQIEQEHPVLQVANQFRHVLGFDGLPYFARPRQLPQGLMIVPGVFLQSRQRFVAAGQACAAGALEGSHRFHQQFARPRIAPPTQVALGQLPLCFCHRVQIQAHHSQLQCQHSFELRRGSVDIAGCFERRGQH